MGEELLLDELILLRFGALNQNIKNLEEIIQHDFQYRYRRSQTQVIDICKHYDTQARHLFKQIDSFNDDHKTIPPNVIDKMEILYGCCENINSMIDMMYYEASNIYTHSYPYAINYALK